MAPLRVSGVEAIARSRLLTVAVGAVLVDVAALLSGAQISVVMVCDATGAAVGVVTETTLVRRLGLGQADFFTTRAGEVMTPEFTACTVEDLLSDVLAMMQMRGLIHLLLLDPGKHPLAVLNARDGPHSPLLERRDGRQHRRPGPRPARRARPEATLDRPR